MTKERVYTSKNAHITIKKSVCTSKNAHMIRKTCVPLTNVHTGLFSKPLEDDDDSLSTPVPHTPALHTLRADEAEGRIKPIGHAESHITKGISHVRSAGELEVGARRRGAGGGVGGGGCVGGGDWGVGGGEVKIRGKVKIDGELWRHLVTRREKGVLR